MRPHENLPESHRGPNPGLQVGKRGGGPGRRGQVALFGDVSHYRDKQERECDAVVKIRGGKYGLVEIKLGGSALVEEGAKTLNALEALIDTKKSGRPAFKMVLTAVGDHPYRRPDEVLVCPIGCLGP